MGKINKLTKQGETVYPITVSDAVINPDTKRSVTQELKRTLQATGVDSFEDFSEAMDYSAGDKVWHDDTLYEFTAEHPKGAWTGTDVRETSFKKDLDRIFSFEENPEFVYSVLDSEGKLLLGIKENGEPYFPKNETYRVESNQEFLAAWVDAAGHVLFGLRTDGSTYVAKADFLTKIEEITKLLDENSIKDEEIAAQVKQLQDTFSFVSNDEWLHAVVDAEGKLLFGIKAENGEVVMPKQDTYKVVKNDEWLAAWLDATDKILFGVKADGTFWAAKHNFSTGGNYDGEIEDINNTLSSMQGTITDLADKIADIDTSGIANTVFSVIDDAEERLSVTTDKDERVISYRDKDGVLHENKGIDTSKYYLNGEEKDFTDRSEIAGEVTKAAENGAVKLENVDGVSNHNTPNLLIADEMQKTFNDGTNSFTPPNAGYEMSNPIECKAGDWFTRTGTATGMVVVTDENDKNGTRLFNADGTTLGNTFQVPTDMTWVKYIRMAAEVTGAEDGSVVICKGKEAYTADNRGDYVTVDKLRLQNANIPKDIKYLKSSDGKYWELYVDESHKLQIREIDPDIITELPADFPVYTISGDYGEYFDTYTSFRLPYLMERNKNGVLKYYKAENDQTSYADFRKTKNSSNEVRYLKAYTEGYKGPQGEKLLTIYDENFKIIDTNIGGQNGRDIDPHDYVYFDDNHVATFGHENGIISIPANEENSDFVEINFGSITNYLAYILEWKKIDGVWTIIGEFNMKDYPRLLTDAFGCYSDNETLGVHPNTLFLDYDGNYVMNLRNNDSWIKIKRAENSDGTVTIGSKTLDYNEAIIGRVGGKYNSGYIDPKRVLEEGFTFTDVPTSLHTRSTDEEPAWKFYHVHDVAYWGMKTIGDKQYPTYTLFDNNMWTGNSQTSNYIDINPRNNYLNNPTANNENSFVEGKSDDGGAYDTNMVSRVVQLSIDWENHLIKDYRAYIIPKHYSGTRGSAQMFDEGVLLINWSDQSECGLYDFNDEQAQVENHTYKNGKELWHISNLSSFRVYGYKITN